MNVREGEIPVAIVSIERIPKEKHIVHDFAGGFMAQCYINCETITTRAFDIPTALRLMAHELTNERTRYD